MIKEQDYMYNSLKKDLQELIALFLFTDKLLDIFKNGLTLYLLLLLFNFQIF